MRRRISAREAARMFEDVQNTCLDRLLDFAEPAPDDICLDITCRHGQIADALATRVRHVTCVDATPQPTAAVVPAPGTIRADPGALPYRDHSFTLITVRFALHHLSDARRAVREMLRVCRPDGRLIIADFIRRDPAGDGRDRLERLRDPAHPMSPSLDQMTGLLVDAGAGVRRLELFTVERPAEPWLAGAADEETAARLRHMLSAEVDGGPRTGAKPRMIGGELWFTQSLIHVAAGPAASRASRWQRAQREPGGNVAIRCRPRRWHR